MFFNFSKTFFDQIDEDLEYPSSYMDLHRELGISFDTAVMSLADNKLISRFDLVNSNSLFWLEEDGWTENFVEYPEKYIPFRSCTSQLLTVKNLKTER